MDFFAQVNTSNNFNEDVTREKHLPLIQVEDVGNDKHKIIVDVGGGKHPNDIDHWIQWVEVRLDDMFVGRAEFSAKVMEPVVEFVVNCKGTCNISALARCNKHGLWLTTAKCS
ncbi:MAG: class II SORL domain-containing protein [Spirochaetes bacterium]|nr:class II SORL domain-containing protein [Spirochaetota bacterium]